MEPNKIKRFDTYPDDDHVRMFTTEDARGDWCKSEDVAKLEAINAELLEALEGLSKKAAQHFWRDTVVIRARAAIAKAKGEQP